MSGLQCFYSDKGVNIQPVASPDGKYIVYNSNRSGAFDIWRINSGGTNPVQLTDFKDGADVQYDFAEDGKILIFTRQRNDGGNPTVMKVPVEGGVAVALFDPSGKSPKRYARVSPEGKRIAYQTFSYSEQAAHYSENVEITGFKDGEVIASENPVELARQNGF